MLEPHMRRDANRRMKLYYGKHTLIACSFKGWPDRSAAGVVWTEFKSRFQ